MNSIESSLTHVKLPVCGMTTQNLTAGTLSEQYPIGIFHNIDITVLN